MHRNVATTQGRNSFPVDSSGVVGSVAQQHHRPDGQVSRLLGQLLETRAQVCHRSRRLQIAETLHGRNMAIQAVKTHLEIFLQVSQNPAFQDLHRRGRDE